MTARCQRIVFNRQGPDDKPERFIGANVEQAKKYLKCSYREPFVIRDSV